MKKIEYYIPERREELKDLVGKLVILCPSEYEVPFSGDPFTYFGFNNDAHEFIKQRQWYEDSSRTFYSTKVIRGWLVKDEHLDFTQEGIYAKLKQDIGYTPTAIGSQVD